MVIPPSKATNIGNVAEVENQVEAGVAENLVTKMNLLTESKKKALDEWERIAQGIERIDTLMEQTKNAALMEKKRVLMRGKIEKDAEISELEKRYRRLSWQWKRQMWRRLQLTVMCIREPAFPSME